MLSLVSLFVKKSGDFWGLQTSTSLVKGLKAGHAEVVLVNDP